MKKLVIGFAIAASMSGVTAKALDLPLYTVGTVVSIYVNIVESVQVVVTGPFVTTTLIAEGEPIALAELQDAKKDAKEYMASNEGNPVISPALNKTINLVYAKAANDEILHPEYVQVAGLSKEQVIAGIAMAD